MKNKKITFTTIAFIMLVLLVIAWFNIGREKVVLIGVANRFLKNEKYDAAVTVLRINTKIYPQSASAHSALARAYFYSGHRSECFKSIRKARDIDPHRLVDIIFWKQLTLVPEDFKVPVKLETETFRTRPLKATDVELDYKAVMSSVEHLKGALGDDWPDEDMTIEEDLRALELHEKEFERRERFVYTVMNLDETECLGCIYIRPSRLDEFDAEVVMWVTRDAFQNGLDGALLKTLRNWLETDWPFDKVLFPGRDMEWTEIFDRLSEQDKNLH